MLAKFLQLGEIQAFSHKTKVPKDPQSHFQITISLNNKYTTSLLNSKQLFRNYGPATGITAQVSHQV